MIQDQFEQFGNDLGKISKKNHFSNEFSEPLKNTILIFFNKFLSDKVETVLWESEEKRSKLFKSKFGQRKLLVKSFWSYLELKSECSERLKRAFFSF